MLGDTGSGHAVSTSILSGHLLVLPDPEALARQFGTAHAPFVLDVRISEDVATRPAWLPLSVRAEAELYAGWLPSLAAEVRGVRGTCLPYPPIVVVCHRGLKISQGIAALLRAEGVSAVHLVGGCEAWAQTNLAMRKTSPRWLAGSRPVLSPGDVAAPVFVLPQRPQFAGLVAAWTAIRFVDPTARILTVDPTAISAVAERFQAIELPSDVASLTTLTSRLALTSAMELDQFVTFVSASRERLTDVVHGLHLSHHDDSMLIQNAFPLCDAVFAHWRHGRAKLGDLVPGHRHDSVASHGATLYRGSGQ